jgi:pimeloyl-ACP methyl ester carboxylesterase
LRQSLRQRLWETKSAFLGYSLGAVVAASLAGHRPDLVDRLVLISGWIKTDAQQILRNGIWQTLRKEKSSALREYTVFCALSGDFQTLLQPQDFQRIVESIQTNEFIDQQMDLNRRVDISDAVESIQMPTLVIGCSDDQMVPKRHSKALFGAIIDARYLEITSGHAVLHERTAEVLRAASGFFYNPTFYPAGTNIETSRP